MSTERDTLIGILALIFGFLVILLSLTKFFTLDAIIGIGIFILGIWLLVISYDARRYTESGSMIYLTIALVAIINGLALYGNINIFNFTMEAWRYLTGLLILITGLLTLLGQTNTEKITGSIGVILGFIFIILNYYDANIYYMVIIIGIWLIIAGIIQFSISYEEKYRNTWH
ncbi:DUF308 domain-containing protein [Methanobacterium oryzae]|uniref:DUF308 domain-containing protein n=1 Tax=Methanobacterium oryzae TaxID=69540 RepID=UPI003D1BAF48